MVDLGHFSREKNYFSFVFIKFLSPFRNNYIMSYKITQKYFSVHIHFKTEPRLIYERRAEGAILHSKIRWIEKGEKPTNYFFNMERRNYNNKTISELSNAEGETISKDDDILEEIRNFYQILYTADRNIGSNESFQAFTENLKTNLPKLFEDKKVQLEGKLT